MNCNLCDNSILVESQEWEAMVCEQCGFLISWKTVLPIHHATTTTTINRSVNPATSILIVKPHVPKVTTTDTVKMDHVPR